MKSFLLVTILLFGAFFVPISAQTASDLLPCDQYNSTVFDACGDVNSQVGVLIRLILALFFVIIIIYGIFLIVKAALSIIRSEGDPTKVQEGAQILRGVYIGIAIIFIGIIGLIVVLAFFGATGILDTVINAPANTTIPLITD